jgi:hypothetical protein
MIRLRLVLAPLLLLPTLAAAQPRTEADLATLANNLRQEPAQRRIDSLTNARPPGVPLYGNAPMGFVTATSENQVISVEGGIHIVTPFFSQGTLKLAGTAPLKEGKGPVNFAGLRGLGDGTTLSLSFGGGTRFGTVATRPSDRIAWCRTVKKEAADQGKPDPFPEIPADCSGMLDINMFYSSPLYREYLRTTNWQNPVLFELTGTLGRSSNSYLDATTFQPATEDRLSYSVGGTIGYLAGLSLWSLEAGYKVDYEAQSKAEICAPLAGGALRCRSGSLGAPERAEGVVVTLQNRQLFPETSRLRNIGINPLLTYNVNDESVSLDFPIYFIGKDSGILGGIAPGYSPAADQNFSLRVFLGGTPFSFGL